MKLTVKKDRIILFHAIRNGILVNPKKYAGYDEDNIVYSFDDEEVLL